MVIFPLCYIMKKYRLVEILILKLLLVWQFYEINTFNGYRIKLHGLQNTSCQQLFEPGFTILSHIRYCSAWSSKKNFNVVMFVISSIEHFELRRILRDTWGAHRDLPLIFVVGKTRNVYLAEKLQAEQFEFEDMIQGNFYDSYINLTLKSISILEFATKYCSEAKYILKCDDDVKLNVSQLQQIVANNLHNDALIGELRLNENPIRDKKSKYYLPKKEYEKDIFPPYLRGSAYLIPTVVIKKLYNYAITENCIRIEDVFITGIIPEKLGIKLNNNDMFKLFWQ